MKRNIGKTLASGSAKQRIKLFAENSARMRHGEEPLLNDQETEELYNSFKTPSEVRMYNRWIDLDRAVGTAISNLQGLKFETLYHIATLRGYILVWEALQGTEELANYILFHIKDQEEREKIIKKARSSTHFLLSKMEPDQEGYLRLDINKHVEKGYSLSQIMMMNRDRIILAAGKLKAWRQAIIDAMEAEGMIINTYKDIADEHLRAIEIPAINWAKYKRREGREEERSGKILTKYEMSPDIAGVEMDQEEYERFYEAFFNG
jgi:hypothetical protein